jgi:hypothetical protein
MIAIDITFCGKGETIFGWPATPVSSTVRDGLKVAILDGGTASGRPSVMMRVPLEDGTVAIVELTARHWNAVTAAILGRYPDLLKGD